MDRNTHTSHPVYRRVVHLFHLIPGVFDPAASGFMADPEIGLAHRAYRYPRPAERASVHSRRPREPRASPGSPSALSAGPSSPTAVSATAKTSSSPPSLPAVLSRLCPDPAAPSGRQLGHRPPVLLNGWGKFPTCRTDTGSWMGPRGGGGQPSGATHDTTRRDANKRRSVARGRRSGRSRRRRHDPAVR